jgi:hypothetical protein
MYNALLGAPLSGVDEVSVGVMAVSCSHFVLKMMMMMMMMMI